MISSPHTHMSLNINQLVHSCTVNRIYRSSDAEIHPSQAKAHLNMNKLYKSNSYGALLASSIGILGLFQPMPIQELIECRAAYAEVGRGSGDVSASPLHSKTN